MLGSAVAADVLPDEILAVGGVEMFVEQAAVGEREGGAADRGQRRASRRPSFLPLAGLPPGRNAPDRMSFSMPAFSSASSLFSSTFASR